MSGPRATDRDRRIGALLKQQRETLGLRPQAVADAIGIGRMGYLKWEEGKTRLTLDRLGRVAPVLGVSVVDLFQDPDAGGPGSRRPTEKSAAATEQATRSTPMESTQKLAYVESHLKSLVQISGDYPLLRHLLSMAVLEAREILEKNKRS